jgi:hypothetical protein
MLAAACVAAADAPPAIPPLTPVTVCEILADVHAHEGKNYAVLGRFSFRRDGRWIGEQACDAPVTAPPMLWLDEDSTGGPKPPGDFELEAAVLNKKFAALTKRTTLAKFRFGSTDYDRWAVVFGRVEARTGEAARKAAANLVIRGDGVVTFLTTDK